MLRGMMLAGVVRPVCGRMMLLDCVVHRVRCCVMCGRRCGGKGHDGVKGDHRGSSGRDNEGKA